jgi:hypothetical protein
MLQYFKYVLVTMWISWLIENEIVKTSIKQRDYSPCEEHMVFAIMNIAYITCLRQSCPSA